MGLMMIEECIARRSFMGFIDDTDDGKFNDLELIYSLPISFPDFYRILCLQEQQSLHRLPSFHESNRLHVIEHAQSEHD